MGNSGSSSTVDLSLLSVTLATGATVKVFAHKDLTLRENKDSRIVESSSVESISVHPDDDGGVVGLRVWPGAISFSDYLLSVSSLFHSRTIIELGCGVGLPSLVLAKHCGAQSVILTDRASVGSVVAKNIRTNNVSGNSVFDPLDWGNKTHLDSFRSRYPHVDFVIGTEIVYAEEQEPLLNALSAVCQPNMDGSKPVVILFYTNRSDDDEQYLSRILERFSVTVRFGSVFHLMHRD